MAITTYNDFVDNYLTKNGMIGNAANINKAPDQLKLEVDELNSTKANITDVLTEQEVNDGFVSKTSSTGSAQLPAGDTSQRDINPIEGMIRYNTETNSFEGYSNGVWQPVGGGQMLGQALIKAVSYNAQVINEDIVVSAGLNAYSVGDITIENGYSVTVENGSVYKIL